MVEPYLHLNGRRMILTDETEVNIGNVVQILRKALPYHWKNRSEISYLWSYYKGRQPILNRVKEVRPEITNKIVENRANEIVSFKSGYLMGEPLLWKMRVLWGLTFPRQLHLRLRYLKRNLTLRITQISKHRGEPFSPLYKGVIYYDESGIY